MGHDQINICVVGEESNPIGIRSHEVLFFAIDREDRATSFGIAGNG
jgi:hypothetical protein